MPISMKGQVAVVTGAGRGLGRAYALELARLGASVVVNDLVEERCDQVVGEIEAKGGAASSSYDSVATPEGCQAIVDVAMAEFGTIDTIVANAGFMLNGLFADQTSEMLEAMLDVHVKGAFYLTQAAWPVMRAKNYGRVVLVSSGGGLFAMRGVANYAAAKAGIYGLCKALASEGEAEGILVNAVLPGATTSISTGNPVPGMSAQITPGLREKLEPRKLPEAVAAFVAFLASPACTVSGEAFKADSGVYSRVFVGMTHGWAAPDAGNVVADDIVEHLTEIRDLVGYTIPNDNYDFVEILGRRLGLLPPTGKGPDDT